MGPVWCAGRAEPAGGRRAARLCASETNIGYCGRALAALESHRRGDIATDQVWGFPEGRTWHGTCGPHGSGSERRARPPETSGRWLPRGIPPHALRTDRGSGLFGKLRASAGPSRPVGGGGYVAMGPSPRSRGSSLDWFQGDGRSLRPEACGCAHVLICDRGVPAGRFSFEELATRWRRQPAT